MRRTLPLLLSVLLLLFASPTLQAQDSQVVGTWEITWEAFRGPAVLTLQLEQDGSVLSGTGEISLSGGPQGRSPRPLEVEIDEGSVTGDQVTFSFSMEPMGRRQMARELTMTFTGTVSGDTMEGTVVGMRGNENPFTGTKISQ